MKKTKKQKVWDLFMGVDTLLDKIAKQKDYCSGSKEWEHWEGVELYATCLFKELGKLLKECE